MIRKESLYDWWEEVGSRYKVDKLLTRIGENEETITLLLEYGNHSMIVGRFDTTKGYGYVFDRRREVRLV